MPVFNQVPKIREVTKISDTDDGKVLTAKDGEAVWEEATGGSVNVVTAGSATELPSNVPDHTIGLVPAESEGSELPEVTEADNGKVLGVDGGSWKAIDLPETPEAENPLPEITADDDGKVLTAEGGLPVWKEPTGGGSSVQSDYNQNDSEQPDYIKNRPFYEETVTGEVVIEYDGDPTGKVVVSMGEDGQLVKVSDLTPEPSELIGGTGIVNGESMTITEDMVMDGRTEGIPAVVVAEVMFVFYSPFAAYGITETGIYFADMGVAATLKYTGTVTNIKKLDPKFLEFFKVSDTPIVDETVNVGPDGGTFSNAFTLVVGETYSVEFDGTRYSCVSKSVVVGEIIVIYVGNANIYFGLEDTGEPFCIFCFEGGSAVDTRLEHEGDRSIKIYHVECAKIPKECLPDDIGGDCGLPEVTEADNGKFLQVVDGAYALVALTDVSVEGA